MINIYKWLSGMSRTQFLASLAVKGERQKPSNLTRRNLALLAQQRRTRAARPQGPKLLGKRI